MSWVPIVILGALLNVSVNYGYKIAASGTGPEWVAAAVIAIASITLLSFAVITRRQGWENILVGRAPIAIVAMGLGVSAAFACFLTALATGPISLIDPMWACIYSLTSLLIGAILIRERPSLWAIAGIALYLFGAGLMGFSDYKGDGSGNLWALLVLVGATANGFINYGYKTYAAKIDIFILIGAVYVVTTLGLVAYGLTQNSMGWSGLWSGYAPLVMLAMGIFTPCVVVMMITALLRGPISLVDPLWACIYALGSVAIGMYAAAEHPATAALIGVALYLVGAFLMARDAKKSEQAS
jgi:drug/metabolite transporter (DMT)-like permease